MAATYSFFRPARLPLQAHELDAETVTPLDDASVVRAALDRAMPGIRWTDSWGNVSVGALWMEFHLPDGQGANTLTLRCSLRGDYSAIVQGLCDALAWIAFDETPRCYQPSRPPISV